MLWWTAQQLKSKDIDVRLKAIEKLEADGSTKAGEALMAAFADPEESIRKAAAKAVGYTRNEDLLQPLLHLLRDKTETVRESAADALRQLRNRDAVPALVPLLSDPGAGVRWQAARALESFGWEPDNHAAAARFAVARGKIEEAAGYGAEAIEALTTVLVVGAYHQRREAVTALCHIPDARVTKSLLVALRDSDGQVRAAAAEALARIGDASCVEALIEALNDNHKQVRVVAVEALGQFGGAKAVEPLLRLRNDQQWEVREAACVALGRSRDPRAFDPLVAALKDPDREVREAGVRGLLHFGDARCIGPLLVALIDEQDSVRQLALVALTSINPGWERTPAARDAMPMFQNALKSGQYWIRQSATDVLARIAGAKEHAPVVEPPAAEVATPGPTLVNDNHLRKQATVDVLVGLLSDFDRELRFAAAETLGKLGQASALVALQRSLKDGDKLVRKAAAAAIETLRGKPTPETNLILRGDDFPL
jgi:HEAT repeat protein